MINKFFISLIICLSTLESCNTKINAGQMAGYQSVKQEQFSELAKDSNAMVMDVRTPEEIAEGTIAGADLFLDCEGDDFKAKLRTLDTSKTYLLYCRSGKRSSAACEIMIESGFRHVYNLEGGIKGWTGALSKD